MSGISAAAFNTASTSDGGAGPALSVSTDERLPKSSDGSTNGYGYVLAREHGCKRWMKVHWSHVTRREHAEWRPTKEVPRT